MANFIIRKATEKNIKIIKLKKLTSKIFWNRKIKYKIYDEIQWQILMFI